jgi:hypothetical protein
MSREIRLSDRIKQLSNDPGTATFIFDSAWPGYSEFRDFYRNGDVIFYTATDGTRYEIGSGEYQNDTLTRYPFRNNRINYGPYYVNDASASGPTQGQQGYFYPLYITKSAASGLAGYTGPLPTDLYEYTFSGYPGTTFYMPNNHQGIAVTSFHAGVSGMNYAASGSPVNFQGKTEIYVSYPLKYSVFTGAGTSGYKEPKHGGVAFWANEQTLDYDNDFVWSTGKMAIGISQPSPVYPIDIGGLPSYSQIRASGFIEGGSGIAFSGGQTLPQNILKIASGGKQLEPFYRNELDNQTGTDQVFALSGLVDQRLLFQKQFKGQVFAGPPSGCSMMGCSPDYPEFRYLSLEDIPDLSSLYVVQQNYFPASQIPTGAIAFTTASGKIEYDQQLFFDKSTNYLNINGSILATSDIYTSGNISVSGNIIIAGTGTKIGTSTSQKIGFWNATPVVQPASGSLGSATFDSPGGGNVIKTDDTFDGYTVQQVVKALRDVGILA